MMGGSGKLFLLAWVGESSLGAHCDTLGPTAQSIAPGMRGRKVCGHKERAGRIGASFTKPITAALTAMACAPLRGCGKTALACHLVMHGVGTQDPNPCVRFPITPCRLIDPSHTWIFVSKRDRRNSSGHDVPCKVNKKVHWV